MLDERNIRFLEQFRGDGSFVIAAISSAPLLLGKAGLLESKRFTHGVFEEFLDAFPVIPREGVARTFLVEDGNLVTAYGGAFREFAAAVARKVGIDCSDTVFEPMAGKNCSEEDFVFHLPPEVMEEARADWDRCLEEAGG
jgi:4-methyl-5(b-hydroxyethyl)-thiazole monophosphate biosynthesis